MECYTYLRNVHRPVVWWGRRPMKDVLGEAIWKDLFIPFGSLVWVNPSIWKESFTLDCSSDTLSTRGGIWKGDVLVEDLEELETMDASEIYSKRLNAKEVIFHQKGEFTFSNSRWTNRNTRRRSETENIHLDTCRDQIEERVTHWTFLENQKDLFHNLMTHFRLPVKLWTSSGPCREASYTAITFEPRVALLLAERRIIPYSTEVHWRLPELLIRLWMSS